MEDEWLGGVGGGDGVGELLRDGVEGGVGGFDGVGGGGGTPELHCVQFQRPRAFSRQFDVFS